MQTPILTVAENEHGMYEIRNGKDLVALVAHKGWATLLSTAPQMIDTLLDWMIVEDLIRGKSIEDAEVSIELLQLRTQTVVKLATMQEQEVTK
jgi:hypothetical protein